MKWKPCHDSEIISLPKYLAQNILLQKTISNLSRDILALENFHFGNEIKPCPDSEIISLLKDLEKFHIHKNLTESRNLDLVQTVILDEFWQSQVSTCEISNFQEFDRVRSGLVKISKQQKFV